MIDLTQVGVSADLSGIDAISRGFDGATKRASALDAAIEKVVARLQKVGGRSVELFQRAASGVGGAGLAAAAAARDVVSGSARAISQSVSVRVTGVGEVAALAGAVTKSEDALKRATATTNTYGAAVKTASANAGLFARVSGAIASGYSRVAAVVASVADALRRSGAQITGVGTATQAAASGVAALIPATSGAGNAAGQAGVRFISLAGAARIAAIGLAAATAAAIATGSAAFGATEKVRQFENRLRIVSGSSGEAFATARRDVITIAKATFQDLDAVSTTYTAIARSAKALGLAQRDVAEVTEIVAKAIALSGASTQAAQASLIQFGQALAGDFKSSAQELNSILEQTPGLSQAIADGLGVVPARLKRMAQEGLLSSKIVIDALKRQKEAVDATFKGTQRSAADAFTLIRLNADLALNDAFRPINDVLVKGLIAFGQFLGGPVVENGAKAFGAALRNAVDGVGGILGTIRALWEQIETAAYAAAAAAAAYAAVSLAGSLVQLAAASNALKGLASAGGALAALNLGGFVAAIGRAVSGFAGLRIAIVAARAAFAGLAALAAANPIALAVAAAVGLIVFFRKEIVEAARDLSELVFGTRDLDAVIKGAITTVAQLAKAVTDGFLQKVKEKIEGVRTAAAVIAPLLQAMIPDLGPQVADFIEGSKGILEFLTRLAGAAGEVNKQLLLIGAKDFAQKSGLSGNVTAASIQNLQKQFTAENDRAFAAIIAADIKASSGGFDRPTPVRQTLTEAQKTYLKGLADKLADLETRLNIESATGGLGRSQAGRIEEVTTRLTLLNDAMKDGVDLSINGGEALKTIDLIAKRAGQLAATKYRLEFVAGLVDDTAEARRKLAANEALAPTLRIDPRAVGELEKAKTLAEETQKAIERGFSFEGGKNANLLKGIKDLAEARAKYANEEGLIQIVRKQAEDREQAAAELQARAAERRIEALRTSFDIADSIRAIEAEAAREIIRGTQALNERKAALSRLSPGSNPEIVQAATSAVAEAEVALSRLTGVVADEARDRVRQLKEEILTIDDVLYDAVDKAFSGEFKGKDFFKQIGKAFLADTVVNPLKGQIKQSIRKSLFGDDSDQQNRFSAGSVRAAVETGVNGANIKPFLDKFYAAGEALGRGVNGAAGPVRAPSSQPKNPVDQAKNAVSGVTDSIKKGFSGLFGSGSPLSGIGKAVGGVANAVSGVVGGVGKAIGSVVNGVLGVASKVFAPIAAISAAVNFVKGAVELFKGLFSKPSDFVGQVLIDPAKGKILGEASRDQSEGSLANLKASRAIAEAVADLFRRVQTATGGELRDNPATPFYENLLNFAVGSRDGIRFGFQGADGRLVNTQTFTASEAGADQAVQAALKTLLGQLVGANEKILADFREMGTITAEMVENYIRTAKRRAELEEDFLTYLTGVNGDVLRQYNDLRRQQREQRDEVRSIGGFSQEALLGFEIKLQQERVKFLSELTETQRASLANVVSASEFALADLLGLVNREVAAVNANIVDSAEAFDRAKASIRDFLKELDFGSFSGLSPLEQLKASTNEFRATLAKARFGDQEALSEIVSIANRTLALNRDVNATGPRGIALQNEIVGALRELEKLPRPEAQTAQNSPVVSDLAKIRDLVNAAVNGGVGTPDFTKVREALAASNLDPALVARLGEALTGVEQSLALGSPIDGAIRMGNQQVATAIYSQSPLLARIATSTETMAGAQQRLVQNTADTADGVGVLVDQRQAPRTQAPAQPAVVVSGVSPYATGTSVARGRLQESY